MLKIGFFGGSFNPPHIDHKRIIEYLLETKIVDKVIIVPVSSEYPKAHLVSFKDRFNMLSLMFQKYEEIEISDFEKDTGNLKTHQVLKFLNQKYSDSENYFIMGSDNLNNMANWENYQEILENYNIISIERDNQKNNYRRGNINQIKINTTGISSTKIRNNFVKNKHQVTDEVYKYIIEKDFYQK